MKTDRRDVTREESTAFGKGTRQATPRITSAPPPDPERIRYAKAKFGEVVLVCSKCAKRQGLSKGGVRTLLKRAVKERMASASREVRKPRIVEVGCLGPCPKRTVAVATTATLAQGRIALVDPRGEGQAILDALLPDFGPKAQLTPPGASEASPPVRITPERGDRPHEAGPQRRVP